jgi:hypothetical protein
MAAEEKTFQLSISNSSVSEVSILLAQQRQPVICGIKKGACIDLHYQKDFHLHQ